MNALIATLAYVMSLVATLEVHRSVGMAMTELTALGAAEQSPAPEKLRAFLAAWPFEMARQFSFSLEYILQSATSIDAEAFDLHITGGLAHFAEPHQRGFDDFATLVELAAEDAGYPVSEVWALAYQIGLAGHDTFSSNVNINVSINSDGGALDSKGQFANAGHNTIVVNAGYTTAYLYNDDNTFDLRGGTAIVFSYNGPLHSVSSNNNLTLYEYDMSNFVFY